MRVILGLLLIFLLSTQAWADTEFFDRFDDPYLAGYVQEGLQNNHDLQKAVWQVEEYRQNVKASFAKELPSLSTGAYYTGFHVPSLANSPLHKNAFILPFIARYEPDFLLKNRDKTKSTKKAYESMEFQKEAVAISLASDIATVYINLLQYDSLIDSQKKVVALNEQIAARSQKKYDRGVIDNATLNSAKKDLETAKNTLDDLNKQRETALTQFALLLGRSPGEEIQRGKLETFEYKQQIPDTISSDVIFSRPDVLSAEKQLEMANIDVRVARKEFLPSFNIIGILAFNTIFPGSFFNWDSILASILAGASQDIFTGGAKVANLKIYKARYEQLFETYRQTDLNAVKEVNDALVIIKIDTVTDNNTIEKLRLQTRDFADSGKKFKRGVISEPDLLSAEQMLLNVQQTQTQTKTVRLVNYLTLYKAAGGKL